MAPLQDPSRPPTRSLTPLVNRLLPAYSAQIHSVLLPLVLQSARAFLPPLDLSVRLPRFQRLLENYHYREDLLKPSRSGYPFFRQQRGQRIEALLAKIERDSNAQAVTHAGLKSATGVQDRQLGVARICRVRTEGYIRTVRQGVREVQKCGGQRG
jgi:hypothetical protein